MLLEKFRLVEHCSAIKRYLLLGQGDFVQCLMDAVGPELDASPARVSAFKLVGTLESAVRGKHKELVKLLKSHGGKVAQRGELVELEMSALAGYVVLNAPEGDPEMDWEARSNDRMSNDRKSNDRTIERGVWRSQPFPRRARARRSRAATCSWRTRWARARSAPCTRASGAARGSPSRS